MISCVFGAVFSERGNVLSTLINPISHCDAGVSSAEDADNSSKYISCLYFTNVLFFPQIKQKFSSPATRDRLHQKPFSIL